MAKPMSMVIPRAFSSGRRSQSMPVRALTSEVLPWSMWPAVPRIKSRAMKLSFAVKFLLHCNGPPIGGEPFMLGTTLDTRSLLERVGQELLRIDPAEVKALADAIYECYQHRRLVFIIGNGGSGSN